MYKLVIVESPSKCKKIQSYLGDGYKCIASYGHFRELNIKKGLKCIDIEHGYEPIFLLSKSKSKQITKLREMIKEANEVILATDDDREGEAIAWHICMVFKLPVLKTKRIIFHEITKSALEKAVANPTIIDMKKVYSQQARQVLDLLVGYSISPLLWKYINKTSVSSLSAGRCQTPALRLVYENEKDIENNPGIECYNISGTFILDNKEEIIMKLNNTLENKELVKEFLEKSKKIKYSLKKEKIKLVKRKAPEPLTTSSLQQKASNILGYSPKDTMRICQNLYEEGYITYMRTDSKNYSKEFIEKTKNYIDDKYNSRYISNNINNLSLRVTEKKKKGKKENSAQEAHEAIRPTKVELNELLVESKKIGSKERRMYNFIWKTTVQSCMSEAELSSLTIKVNAPLEYYYKHKEEKVEFEGWMILEKYLKENKIYEYLVSNENKISIENKKIECEYALKETKQHYTEAKIVSLLEKKGIGRPSTFSSIISKIQERGYVKKDNIDGKEISCIDYILENNKIKELEKVKKIGNENNKLIIQPLGIIVIEFLLKYFPDIFNYEYTKNMETNLDNIACGKKVWYELCEECYKIITIIKENMNDKVKKENEYMIDENHIYKIARYGPVIETLDEDGKKKFLKVKQDISLDEIRKKKLSLDEIVETREEKIRKELIGRINDKEVIIKKGKFGYYLVYDGKNYSLKGKKDITDISIEYAISIINEKDKTIVREINDEISIRNGKYGDYIYYKTETMKKPKFIPLKKYKGNYKECPIKEIIDYVNENK